VSDPKPPEKKPDAPWGYKKDGTPYKRDPKRYATRSANQAKKVPGDEVPNRAQKVYELLTIPIGVTAVTAQATASKALLADAIVAGKSAPAIATAVADVARDNERFAEIVDRITSTGPYAALFGAVAPLALQIAANHSARIGAVARNMGMASSVDDILASATPKSFDEVFETQGADYAAQGAPESGVA